MNGSQKQWMYMLDGVPQGPFDYVELVTMLESGQLTVHDLVSKPQNPAGKQLKNILILESFR